MLPALVVIRAAAVDHILTETERPMRTRVAVTVFIGRIRMKLIMSQTLACGALLAGTLAFAPLAQAQTSGATGTTSGPASGKTSGKWVTHDAARGGNAAAGNGSGSMIGGAPGQPAKAGSEAGPAPNKTSGGASGTTATKQ